MGDPSFFIDGIGGIWYYDTDFADFFAGKPERERNGSPGRRPAPPESGAGARSMGGQAYGVFKGVF